MKRTGNDIWRAILIVIMGYEEYTSQPLLELNEAKDLEQTSSEGGRISKDWAAINAHSTGVLSSFTL